MSLTNALKMFDIVLALTQGGPGGSTYTATLDIYREAFQHNNFGLGSAKACGFLLYRSGLDATCFMDFPETRGDYDDP
jgi:raffinose/stachyose/melibiose transport system permease protein